MIRILLLLLLIWPAAGPLAQDVVPVGPLSTAAEVTGLWKITAYGDPEFTRVGWMLVRPAVEEGLKMPGPGGQELTVTHELSGFVYIGPGETPDRRIGFTFADGNRAGGTFTAHFWEVDYGNPGQKTVVLNLVPPEGRTMEGTYSGTFLRPLGTDDPLSGERMDGAGAETWFLCVRDVGNMTSIDSAEPYVTGEKPCTEPAPEGDVAAVRIVATQSRFDGLNFVYDDLDEVTVRGQFRVVVEFDDPPDDDTEFVAVRARHADGTVSEATVAARERFPLTFWTEPIFVAPFSTPEPIPASGPFVLADPGDTIAVTAGGRSDRASVIGIRRIDGAVATLSWIHRDSPAGKVVDDPAPDERVSEAFVTKQTTPEGKTFRFSNYLKAWIETADERTVETFGVDGASGMARYPSEFNIASVPFPSNEYPDPDPPPKTVARGGIECVVFQQTVGARTVSQEWGGAFVGGSVGFVVGQVVPGGIISAGVGAVVGRHTASKVFPFAPIWTIVTLELCADGRVTPTFVDRSIFPSMSLYDDADCDGQLCRRSERVALELEERRWYVDGWGAYRPEFGTGNPWNIPPP